MNDSRNIGASSMVNRPFYYGWVIVFVAALGMFFSGPGQTFTISVFINVYMDTFGWSSTLISTMYLFATLLSGMLLFFMGRYIDLYGQRKMLIIIALGLAVACLINSFLIGPVMLFFGFFLLRFFGQGGMTLIPNTLVPQWFIKKRGRAMAFLSVGAVSASASFPPINVWLIDNWGWENAWRFWAVLLSVVFVPLVIWLVRNKPEDIGLLPDGQTSQPDLSENVSKYHSTASDHAQFEEENWTLKEARGSRTFWLLLFCVSIPSMVGTGIVFHIVSLLDGIGISRSAAAFVLTIVAVVTFPMSFVAGIIVEKVKVHIVFAGVFVGYLVAMIILMSAQSWWMIVAFGMALGVTMGFQVICMGIVWPNYFGRKHLGSIKGVSMTTVVIGSAFGPLPFSLVYDWYGTYSPAIIIMMVFAFLGLLAALASPKPIKEKQAADMG